MWMSSDDTNLLLGVLTFLQEVLATHLAGVPVRNPPKDAPSYRHALAQAKVEQKAFTMALYGMFQFLITAKHTRIFTLADTTSSGGLVSAPLGHVLVGTLQKAFAGRTGKWAKFGQILASNLLVAPIQTVGESTIVFIIIYILLTGELDYSVYLACMAVINGGRTVDDVVKTVKGGFMAVIRVFISDSLVATWALTCFQR